MKGDQNKHHEWDLEMTERGGSGGNQIKEAFSNKTSELDADPLGEDG